MLRQCIVPECRSTIEEPFVAFHHFPRDPVLRQNWAKRINIDETLYKKIFPEMLICSKHFLPCDYTVAKPNTKQQQTLKKDALPSLCLSPTVNEPLLPCSSDVNDFKRYMLRDVKLMMELKKPIIVESRVTGISKVLRYSEKSDQWYLTEENIDKTSVKATAHTANCLISKKPDIVSIHPWKPVAPYDDTFVKEIWSSFRFLVVKRKPEEENVTQKKPFTFQYLVHNLEKINIPNSQWTVELCSDCIVCTKLDASNTSEWKVVVYRTLAVRVTAHGDEIPLGMTIDNIEALSSLLRSIEEL